MQETSMVVGVAGAVAVAVGTSVVVAAAVADGYLSHVTLQRLCAEVRR